MREQRTVTGDLRARLGWRQAAVQQEQQLARRRLDRYIGRRMPVPPTDTGRRPFDEPSGAGQARVADPQLECLAGADE